MRLLLLTLCSSFWTVTADAAVGSVEPCKQITIRAQDRACSLTYIPCQNDGDSNGLLAQKEVEVICKDDWKSVCVSPNQDPPMRINGDRINVVRNMTITCTSAQPGYRVILH